jgi:hypothetical protein
MQMRFGIPLFILIAIGALFLHCGDEEPCSGWHCSDAGPVRSADAGISAEPGVLCSEAEDLVFSNTAAKVTLGLYSYVPLSARGVIEIPPPLKEKIIGKPFVEFRDPVSEELMPAQVMNTFTQDYGYSFYVELYDDTGETDYGSMKVEVVFEIECEDADASTSASKAVQSSTYLEWCYYDDYPSEAVSEFGWRSSGDNCMQCDYAECEW